VKEKEQGDVHGRVNHESLGRSLHALAECFEHGDQQTAAADYYRRAAEASERGDVFGRIDWKSLAVSERAVSRCLRRLGRSDEASEWEERAAATERRQSESP
jgi:hypothetical protein